MENVAPKLATNLASYFFFPWQVAAAPASSSASAPAKAQPKPVDPKFKYVPRADFHPMDCSDIIIGMARGNLSRIGDFYTRDRYATLPPPPPPTSPVPFRFDSLSLWMSSFFFVRQPF